MQLNAPVLATKSIDSFTPQKSHLRQIAHTKSQHSVEDLYINEAKIYFWMLLIAFIDDPLTPLETDCSQ
jgi:hypothetical protein